MKLPQDVIDSVVFEALLARGDEDVRPLLASLRGSCSLLKDAASLQAIARRCLSSACILEDLLLAHRRVVLHRFLRLSGGYQRAVQVFLEEIERVRGMKPSVPLPIIAVLCKLTGRLFTQISAYGEVRQGFSWPSVCVSVYVPRGMPCRRAYGILHRNRLCCVFIFHCGARRRRNFCRAP